MNKTQVILRLQILFAVLSFGRVQQLFAQDDLALLKSQCAARLEVHSHKRDTTHKSMAFPTRVLFGFYRNVLSEQISADCAFDLSCSRFSISAIKTFGIFKGGLLTVDRVTRCRSFLAEETIPLYYNTRSGKIIDEPYMY